MAIIQENLPIVFILVGSPLLQGLPGPVVFGNPGMIIRPESLSISRPTRGTITHTAKSAFLDDFGMGIPILSLSGHTGYNEPLPGFAGLPALKVIESLFILYEQSREQLATINADPDLVKLYYFDVLNLQAFSLFPQELTVERMKTRSLLYFYRMRFAVLQDLEADVLETPRHPQVSALTRRDQHTFGIGFESVKNQFANGLTRQTA